MCMFVCVPWQILNLLPFTIIAYTVQFASPLAVFFLRWFDIIYLVFSRYFPVHCILSILHTYKCVVIKFHQYSTQQCIQLKQTDCSEFSFSKCWLINVSWPLIINSLLKAMNFQSHSLWTFIWYKIGILHFTLWLGVRKRWEVCML